MTDTYNAAADVFGDIYPPRRIKVLGAGRFGRIAVERLKSRFPEALLSVTDRDERRVAEITGELKIAGEVHECISSLGGTQPEDDLWIIPSVPVHVAFEWVFGGLGRRGDCRRSAVPEVVAEHVPNPIRAQSGAIYASFATFVCPDYCGERGEICTHTGKKRPGNLYEVLGGVRAPGFDVHVLRSWQLTRGVGGYPGRSLRELAAAVGAKPGAHLIATSCRCHGVIDALEWGG